MNNEVAFGTLRRVGRGLAQVKVEEKMERIQKFKKCRAVGLESLPGEILVKLSDDEDIHVEVAGSKEQVLAVRMQQNNNSVVISYPEADENVVPMQARVARRTLRMIWRLRRNWLSHGKVVTQELLAKLMNAAGWQLKRDDAKDLEITVALPLDVKIFYNGAPNAVCAMMDTQSDVDIELPLGGKVTIQKALNLNVRANAKGNVTVKHLEGVEANLELDGNGSIFVQNGQVRTLRAQIRGTGDIRAMVQAQNAKLTVTGDGDIKVLRVTGRLAQHCVGAGEIVVYGR